MIGDMPRKMPPFVTCQISRHGKRMYYFRRGKGLRTRLPDLGRPESPIHTRSATVHLWVQEQYDKDLLAWEDRTRAHLKQDCGEPRT